jgi:hypothetical protein
LADAPAFNALEAETRRLEHRSLALVPGGAGVIALLGVGMKLLN